MASISVQKATPIDPNPNPSRGDKGAEHMHKFDHTELIEYSELHQGGGLTMASMTIRKLDSDFKVRLRVKAAKNNRSMEEEARHILFAAVGRDEDTRNFAEFMHALFGPENGVDLELPPRELGREPPSFD